MAAYVWSAVEQLRNSTFPPHQDISALLQSVVNFLRPIDVGVQDSRYGHYHMAAGDKMGFLHAASYVSTTDGNYTSFLELSHVQYVFGVANKAFTLSLVSTGLQKMLKRMVGPEGFFTHRNSLFDLLQRVRRSTDSKSDIRDIFKALGVNSQLRDMADPQAYLSLQLMNNVVRTWQLGDLLQDTADLEKIVMSFDERGLRSGYPLRFARAGKRMQFFLDLPSEAGFPLRLQTGATYALEVSGRVSAGVDSSVFKDVREGHPPSQIWARLELDARIVASLSGKISVDGYLLNTGSAFHALATLHTPVHVRASFQPSSDRFTIHVVPTLHETRPVVSLEAKPYVYCLVVSNSLTRPQADVNTRPYFITSQPVLASTGARVADFRYQLGKNLLGVDVTWQGAYPWRADPDTPAAPMVGRSYAALYFRPGEQTPPEICVDFKYLTKPRYMDPETPRRGACDSWWSLLGWMCHGTTAERDDVTIDQHRARPTPAPPAGDFPDLGSSDLTLDAVRARMEQLAGQEIPEPTSGLQRAFILLVNASSSALHRAYGLEVFRQVWQTGRHHSGFYNLYRTHVPGYDDKPWRDLTFSFCEQLFAKTQTTFPEQVTTIADLLSSRHITQTYKDMLDMMKPLEHRVINRQFRSLVYTELSRLAMWKLPSLDPAAMMDRVMPENVYHCQDSVLCKQVKAILKKLLPLVDETWELKTEMKDPLKITSSRDLLLEKVRQVSYAQNETATLLTSIPQNLLHLQPLQAAAVQYLVVKTSQAVLELGNVINRGHRLGLLQFNSATLDLQQQAVFNLASTALSWNSPSSQQRQHDFADNDDSFDQSEALKADHSTAVNIVDDNDVSVENPELRDDRVPRMDISQIVQGYQSLNNQQLKVISHCWSTVVTGRPVEVTELRQLLQAVRDNVTALSRLMTESPRGHSPDLTGLLLQSGLQHQTLIYMLESPHLAPTSDLDQPASEDTVVSAADRYALKIQFKQLTERALVFQGEEKSNLTCLGLLPDQEGKMMLQLFRMDHHLAVFLQAYFRLPDQITPWTSSADDIRAALTETGFPMLAELMEMRPMLLKAGAMPRPCLVMKLVETTLSLQRQIAVLSRSLSAQLDNDQTLNEQASQLSEQTTDFLVSLRDVFDLYVDGRTYDRPLQGDVNNDPDNESPLPTDEPGDRAPGPQDWLQAGPTTGLHTTDCTREICFGANVSYGGPDAAPKRLAIRVHGRKSVEQKLWEVRQFSPETRDGCVTRAVKASLTGRDKLEACPYYVHDSLNTFAHLHLYVHGDELWAPLTESYCPVLGYNVLDRLLTSLEGRHWDRSAVYRPSLARDDNTLQAVLDLHPSLTSADHYYLTPTRTLALQSLPVPSWVQTWYPFQNVLPTSKLALLKMSSAHLPGMCKVQDSSVRTADGAVLSLPWEWRKAAGALGRDCRALLAGDCSSDAAFAVTLLLNASLPAHGIEILAEEHSVVIQPYDQGDSVYVDGNMEDLTYSRPLVFYKKIAYGIEAVAMVVSRNEHGYIRSEYPQLGLDIFVNFQYINIEMSGVYRGQLCGLCGNFDFQTTHELVDGRGRVYPDVDGFFRSYLIPEQSCNLQPKKHRQSLYDKPSNIASGEAAS